MNRIGFVFVIEKRGKKISIREKKEYYMVSGRLF